MQIYELKIYRWRLKSKLGGSVISVVPLTMEKEVIEDFGLFLGSTSGPRPKVLIIIT
jgi:hypothetical protein